MIGRYLGQTAGEAFAVTEKHPRPRATGVKGSVHDEVTEIFGTVEIGLLGAHGAPHTVMGDGGLVAALVEVAAHLLAGSQLHPGWYDSK